MIKQEQAALALCGLYRRSPMRGQGFLHSQCMEELAEEDARKVLGTLGFPGKGAHIDYLWGHMIKTGFKPRPDGQVMVDTLLYDRDYGVGAGEEAILDILTEPRGEKK